LRELAGGSAREQVCEVQRARLLAAAVEVVGACGYGGLSVARVTGRARVSRRTFYDLFDDREDCFLAIFEEAVGRASEVAVRAASGQGGWRERVRAGLGALLVFLGDEPVLGSLLVADALSAGPKVLARRARVLESLHAIVDQGRSQMKAGREPPPLTAEGVVGAVLAVIHARILQTATQPQSAGQPQTAQPPVELLGALMGMIVLPYLGPAAASKELSRPIPTLASTQRQPVKSPLEELHMRVTYRTLRVLATIAAQPAASNREIADLAGVSDQGQISKLLTRLERLELIYNTGPHAKGDPNAWQLTPKGQEIQQAFDIQLDSSPAVIIGSRRSHQA
jgi:AcrR family transcriptional regulator/DNA-binding MarR family transcriptional regulator